MPLVIGRRHDELLRITGSLPLLHNYFLDPAIHSREVVQPIQGGRSISFAKYSQGIGVVDIVGMNAMQPTASS